ncbi:leukotriene A4 hydrolase [Thecamonas trahens ATCC 50062]|uniref:Leukotriene A4 hydrolase n=1 Tax=Thecamonas trahens ATCC 50062 TaxID=461836 RepID=A0A0L0DSC9_THETB|nr:leukotriene A4 hydrolase [Thecamonas trahens ATCC 50062]KNC55175.1 leukotriene A4 hydrolase [Thecamonas trahens ATCC 50062]|eukprot:XP_013753228.1 leukotriene A4 hydrolase [Thecamonas trahens ATCC 50062]
MTDATSAANLDTFTTTNLALDLDVSFATQTITGKATLTLTNSSSEPAASVVLDTRDLTISGVTTAAGEACEFALGDAWGADGCLGAPLTITLPQPVAPAAALELTVAYATSPAASALQWLAPVQTAGGKHPYLMSQCQAIHARSLVPCQDSPAIKAPYSATVTAPSPLRVVMSALLADDPAEAAAAGVWHFNQPVPIPSYLLAIAVGNLAEKPVGPRSSVLCEPELIDACEYEFGEHTETFVAGGEDLLGPYVWGRYDLLVLPPSFAYGGMENPCTTYVTPTLLAGDRSLVNVVAHEIGHSWMGNLVTSASWSDFWLNEGHTVYVERRLLGNLHGEAFRQFEAMQGWATLSKTVNDVFGADHPYTCLVPDLSGGIDPDDVFSSVPYEKGFALLFHLESLVGGIEPMEAFLKAYVAAFANKSVTTAEWHAFFLAHFADSVDPAVLDAIDWQAWFHAPGMPPVTPVFDDSLAFVGDAADIAGWHSGQVVQVLDDLVAAQADGAVIPPPTLAALDAAYGLSSSGNYEILFAWVILAIKTDYEPIIDVAVRLVTSQGRMKFTRPTYRALHASTIGKDIAVATFTANRERYHPICAKMVAKDLGL